MKKQKLFLFFILLVGIASLSRCVQAQTLLFSTRDNTQKPRLFFKSNSTIVFSWSGAPANSKLKLGTLPGIYRSASIPVTASSFNLLPDSLALSIGRYYAVLTNSDSSSLSGIQTQIAANPQLVVSNQIEFIIESQASPAAVAPIGNEPNNTPLFRWTSVPGVPAYQVILSKTPFQVTRDPATGELSVVGANLVWRYITKTNSALYGSVNTNPKYNTITPAPLISGNEYNYTILNVYDEDGNPAYTSDVFGGVVSFKYTGTATIQAPVPKSPSDNSTFFGDNIITFNWDPVPNANLYTVYLFQRVSSTTGAKQEYDVPLWNSTTTSTVIDYPARGTLGRGKYLWYVSVSDASGNGNASATSIFNYSVDMGTFRIEAVQTTGGGGNVVGFEARARAIVGGATPTNPFITTNERFITDSVVVGSYQFTGSKIGYADTTVTVAIPATTAGSSATSVILPFRALPATISGSAIDQAGRPVGGALVQLQNLLTGAQKSSSTSSAGQFSISTEDGTFSVQASKAGFVPSLLVTTTVVVGEQKVLSSPLVIQNDEATISGYVVNDAGSPIVLATVTASAVSSAGSQTQTAVTNSAGNFSFNLSTTLSSGAWTIGTTRDGFVPPPARQVTLSAGQSKQLDNIVMLPNANTINGNVYELITSGGQTGTIPLSGATITATPATGSVLSTTASSTGQFSISLKQGTYRFQTNRDNYSAAPGSQSSYDVSVTVGQTVSGINFTLQANPSSVSGTVLLSDGSPVSGATVSTGAGASAQSLLSGSYTLSVPPGTFTLSSTRDGYGSPAPASVSVAAGQNLKGVNFQMTPNAGVISGSVQSGGEPTAGAVINAQNNATNDSLTSNASANGGFSLSVQPGTWKVTANKTGFIGASSTVTVGPGQRNTGNVFTLVANTAVINGVVSDGSAAIRNASVTFAEPGNPSGATSTVSKDDGSFATTVVAGKSYVVSVSRTGYSSRSVTTQTLATGGSVTLQFTLIATPSSVAGFVRNNLSQPLFPVKVYLISSGQVFLDSTTTDNTGAYKLGTSAGNFTVQSRLPGYVADSVAVSLTVGQSLSGINLSLTENPAVISGSITGSGGVLAGTLINVIGDNGGATVTSGADGSFIVSRIVGGSYSIKISHDGFADSTIGSYTIKDGDSKRLAVDLNPLNGRISGVLTTSGGQTIAGGTVFVRAAGARSYTAISAADGSYSLSSLALGKYFISAAKSGYSSSKIDSVVLAAASLNASSTIGDFTTNALRIKGKVTDALSSTVVNNGNVAISGPGGSGSAITNSAGDYILDNLAQSATYTLTVSKSGYATVTKSVPAGSGDTLLTVDVQLASNIGIISGTVKDNTGGSLPFTVSVKASSPTNNYTTTSDAAGNFTFSGIAKGVTYDVSTDFFRQGYDNVSTSVPFPSDQASVTGVALVVEPRLSEVDGNVGVADALVELTEAGGKISSRILNSLSDNSFAFTFLPSGSYTVKPTKNGFTFTPATQSLSLSASQKFAVPAFSATPDTGSILVKTLDAATNTGMSGVTVSVVSADTTVVKSGTSNSNGDALFSKLPAKGISYIVRASRSGFSADVAQATPTLATNTLITLQFKLSANTSAFAGKVVRSGSTTAITGAQVTARRSTGEQFSASTDASGDFTMRSLPSDNFLIVASKPGFRSDTLSTSLSPSENKTLANLFLTPTTVNVQGTALYDGAGVANLTVTAVSAGSVVTQSDASGSFEFTDLPLQSGADTTVYQIILEKSGLSPRSVTVLIPATRVGQTISLPPIILPSGKIRFTVTDGVRPLDGVRVVFTPFNGSTSESYTTTSGVFESAGTLEKGTHTVSLAKEPYLTPSNALAVTLESDTTKKTSIVFALPFRLLPTGEISASDSATISLFAATKGLSDTARLYYKRESQSSFASVTMSQLNDSSLAGKIPPQLSIEKLSYYTEVKRDATLFTSKVATVSPTARGILSFIDFDPSLDHATLRPKDSYTVRLVSRDGANSPLGKDLLDLSKGKIQWRSSDSTALTITQADTTAFISTTAKEGTFTVTAFATLNNIGVSQSFVVTVAKTVLKIISIGGLPPGGELNNSSHGLQLSVGGQDTSGKFVNVGSSIAWSLSPPAAGTISPGGFLTVDSTLLGRIVVTATDSLSKLVQEIKISVVATVDSSRSFFLTDKNGMQIRIAKKSVGAPVDLQLEDASFGPAKKYVFLKRTGQNFVASPNLYYLTYKGDALAGDSLKQPASFQLTIDASLKFLDGQKLIGLYDPSALEWKILPADAAAGPLGKGSSSQTQTQVLQTNVLTQLKAQYTILALNEPLGLKHAAVLPNPFSPDVSPLRIGYVVSTTDQQALVSLHIYNIRGELVRTLLDGDVEFPGRYGSRASAKEILWDGRTNDGSQARNGRYIIQIKAKDSTGEKVEILQVVLIK